MRLGSSLESKVTCRRAPVRSQLLRRSTVTYAFTTEQKYRFLTKEGSTVNVHVTHAGDAGSKAFVAYAPSRTRAFPKESVLQWKAWRHAPEKGYHPEEAIPGGSSYDESSGTMRTPMWLDERQGAWCSELHVPAYYAPLQLSLSIFNPATGQTESPVHAPNCTVPMGMSPGDPKVMGASVVSAGRDGDDVNFTVFSRGATSMALVLMRVDNNGQTVLPAVSCTAVSLDAHTNRTGDLWHVCLHGLKDIRNLTYAWKAGGGGDKYHDGCLLLDPYASQAVPVQLPDSYWQHSGETHPSQNKEQAQILGSLAPLADANNGQPPLSGINHQSLDSCVMAVVDVRSFARGPDVPPERHGKLLGITNRIPMLRAAGITSIMLTPITLSTHDGRPLSLIAPDPSLAVGGPKAVVRELKQTIQILHEEGIEVIVQMEFCSTGELSDAAGAGVQGMHGLDSNVYYRSTPTGPVLNTAHPVVRKLVLDSLHHWSSQYNVDGYCFLKAENFAQDRYGNVMDNPPLVEEIAFNPISHLKLIAAPSEPGLLPRGGSRGFPHWGIWSQWNYNYTYDMRSYMLHNQHGALSKLATRITGSPDLLAADLHSALPGSLSVSRSPYQAINSLAPLTNCTPLAAELESTGSDTGASEASSPSWNVVVSRSLLLSMFMSKGVPCINAADLASDPSLCRFVSHLVAIRRSYANLVAPPRYDSPRDIRWHGADAGSDPDWSGMSQGAFSNVIAFSTRDGSGAALYVAFNPYSEQVTVTLPEAPEGMCWREAINSGAHPPADAALPRSSEPNADLLTQLTMSAQAGILLVAVPHTA